MKKTFIKCLSTTCGGMIVIAGMVWIVMLLWNGIIPEFTGWKEIGFWQCAGLCVMFRLMTGHIGVSYSEEKRKGRRKHRHLHEKWRKGVERLSEQQTDKDENIVSDNND